MNGISLLDTQLYALFFLIGAFTVKSLYEMKNWASRRDISELWLFFLITFVIHDAWFRPYRLSELGIKWIIIIGIAALFYLKDINFIVTDDKLALLAAVAILPLQIMLLMFVLYLVLLLILKKRLRHGFSHSKQIPTMPVITSSLILALLLSFFVISEYL